MLITSNSVFLSVEDNSIVWLLLSEDCLVFLPMEDSIDPCLTSCYRPHGYWSQKRTHLLLPHFYVITRHIGISTERQAFAWTIGNLVVAYSGCHPGGPGSTHGGVNVIYQIYLITLRNCLLLNEDIACIFCLWLLSTEDSNVIMIYLYWSYEYDNDYNLLKIAVSYDRYLLKISIW